MQSFDQARRKERGSGDPICWPYPSLVAESVVPKRAELTMIAGGPGTGKSAWILSSLINGDGKGNKNRGVYFSADTSGGAQYNRVASIITGYSMALIPSLDPVELDEKVREATEHLWLDTTSNPDWGHINAVIACYEMIYGMPPEVIVIDNLKDLDMGVDDEWRQLEEGCQFANELAKDTGAAVIVLHHVGGEHENGAAPIPLSGIRGKATKTPSMILTMFRSAVSKQLRISVVKNRSGKAQADGHFHLGLSSDLERMEFKELEQS